MMHIINVSAPAPQADSHISKPRSKPMKILCLGMCRTGTESLYAALKKLGYSPYRGSEIMKTYKTSIPLWTEALDAKHNGQGRSWGRRDFDAMLGDYDCVLDVPAILLTEEIIKAYPEAKVILTNRDEYSWLQSLRDTAGPSVTWWTYPYIWQLHEKTRLRVSFLWKCMDILCSKDFSEDGPAIESYRRHNELVKSLVPPDRLLEFRSEHGWEPLCHFLDEKVPDGPYPRINDRKFLYNMQVLAYYYALLVAILKIGAMVSVIPALRYILAH